MFITDNGTVVMCSLMTLRPMVASGGSWVCLCVGCCKFIDSGGGGGLLAVVNGCWFQT